MATNNTSLLTPERNNGQRLLWLDMANIFAMVGVVLFHIPSAAEQPYRAEEFMVVNSCFFFLAGFSFSLSIHCDTHWRTQVKYLLHRAKQLLIPTVFFFFVFYALWLAVGRRMASDTELWYDPITELLRGKLHTVVAPYWFVFCLLTMTVLHTITGLVVRNRTAVALILGLMPLANNLDIPDFYELRYACMLLPVFALGHLLSQPKATRIHYSLLIIGWALSLATEYLITGSTNPSLTSVLGGGVYILLIVWISRRLASLAGLGVMKLLRNGALVLLATQNYIIGICRIGLDKVFGEADYLTNHIGLKPVILIVVYSLSIPLIWFILNRMPWFLGWKQKR